MREGEADLSGGINTQSRTGFFSGAIYRQEWSLYLRKCKHALNKIYRERSASILP